MSAEGFVPPEYPYDRLDDAIGVASKLPGGLVDCSIGTPCDPPPPAVVEALARSGAERGYPTSLGSVAMREAAAGWMSRRLHVEVPVKDVASCIGTKEFVAGLPAWLQLRDPSRDTVLYPAIAYPTYEMGAILARCRAVPVPLGPDGGLDLGAIDGETARRALVLWVNSPANPNGCLTDLAAAAEWGRRHGVLVASDECYVEFTWNGTPATILESGTEGVLAVHSLSKRSNLAGLRIGFYAGDSDLVHYLSELRKHAGFMVPGPVQAAAAIALDDDEHVEAQRKIYHDRLQTMSGVLEGLGLHAPIPPGSFYLWVSPGSEGEASRALRTSSWALTDWLAERGGLVVSPGEFYGEAGAGYVRVAVVQPTDRIELAASRLQSWIASS